MTISSTTRIAGPFVGNGTASVFPFTFKVFAAADLDVVRLDTSTGAESTLVLNSDYSVTLNGDQNSNPGGSITLLAGALATGYTLVITSDIANLQPTDLTNQGGFYPEVITDALDRATIQIQQISDIGERALRIPITDGNINMELPAVGERENKYLVFDASGQPSVSSGSGTDTALRTDLAADTFASAGAGLVGFRQAGANASARTVLSKLRDVVNVKDFGAIGNGVADDTAAIQAAINSGYSLVFPAGTYLCNNLTQSTSYQRFYGQGEVRIIKNANGPLLTCTGQGLLFDGLVFYGGSASGSGLTGDNLVTTGNNVTFNDCGSVWATGRALKATGSGNTINGTRGNYQTDDTSASGYDIEIGNVSSASLYNRLTNITTGSFNGGIYLNNTGASTLTGIQCGKLTSSAALTAGAGGFMLYGGRVKDIKIGGAYTVIMGVIPTVGSTVTFDAGTASCFIYVDNTSSASYLITNNGNANNVIIQATSAGSTMDFRFGDTAAWANTLKLYPDGRWLLPNYAVFGSGYGVKINDSGGTERNLASISSTDNYSFGTVISTNFVNVSAGGSVNLAVGGSGIVTTTTAALRPSADNVTTCGASAQRWSVVYAATGTIATSDARSKEQVRGINAAESAVAMQLKGMISAFKFTDAVAAKGSGARIHFGVIAQDVRDAFIAGGLNPDAYALFCHDSWDAREAVVADDGTIVSPAQEAGDRYGIRYEELLAFIIAAM